MKGLKLGNYKVRPNIARFANEHLMEEQTVNQDVRRKPVENRGKEGPNFDAQFNIGESAQPAMSSSSRPTWAALFNQRDREQKQEVGVVVPSEIKVLDHFYGKALAGRTVHFQTIHSLKDILIDGEVGGLVVHYIEGLYVLLAFDEGAATKKMLLNANSWITWFMMLDIWVGQSLPYERIAWIKVHGVPLHLTASSFFNLIGERFGKVVHESQIHWNDGDLSVDCIVIITRDGKEVKYEVKIVWANKGYIVWVAEEKRDWCPDCVSKIEVKNKEVDRSDSGSGPPNAKETDVNVDGVSVQARKESNILWKLIPDKGEGESGNLNDSHGGSDIEQSNRFFHRDGENANDFFIVGNKAQNIL
ncbi:hypothetical protein HanOQP8_Chr13g0471091 [Helianthus annuus]|nr:hypothetical protein HanOQP8_Chr13g0471091 [Helianthus annuus]